MRVRYEPMTLPKFVSFCGLEQVINPSLISWFRMFAALSLFLALILLYPI